MKFISENPNFSELRKDQILRYFQSKELHYLSEISNLNFAIEFANGHVVEADIDCFAILGTLIRGNRAIAIGNEYTFLFTKSPPFVQAKNSPSLSVVLTFDAGRKGVIKEVVSKEVLLSDLAQAACECREIIRSLIPHFEDKHLEELGITLS